jgi:hypothetical protein
VQHTGAVFEAKFMPPWSFTEEAAEKYMPQLQHYMWANEGSIPNRTQNMIDIISLHHQPERDQPSPRLLSN